MREKILLYLSKFKKVKWDYTEEVTQKGLSEHFDRSRSVLMRHVMKLVKDGLVEYEKKHVINSKVRKNVYLLTNSGRKEAIRIENDIKDA